MSENVAKVQFINFLLKKKYEIEEKKNPVIENHAKSLQAPDILCEFKSDLDELSLLSWLSKLENIIPSSSEPINDLVFGVLYSSDLFPKMVKSKDFSFAKISEFYKNRFQDNKKLLMDFNTKDQGKIKINAPKKIVTRFPPEPSGYLHIGHAKAALLNYHMAKDGAMIVRFDDTNPEKESSEFENAILEDLKLLKIDNYKLSHSSDHFDTIFKYACQLIESGNAYVDNTDVETMRQQRTDGIPSKNRELDPQESLRIFNLMKEGQFSEYCLRAKISVDNPNKAMRDPVIYRHVDVTHHYTGDKYKIYPTYDFTCPILDSIEGVTLTLRTNEYRDRNDQYYWFISALKLENVPKIHDFSRLNFENTVISKRKMKFYVENNFVTGWDDPRMCTIRGLVRLGMNVDALKEYIIQQGASQKTCVVSWDKIWALNKKFIDPVSARYSAVLLEDMVNVNVDVGTSENNCNSDLWIKNGDLEIEVPRNKKNPGLGNKKIIYSREICLSQEDAKVLSVGEEFTLMNWGNAVVLDKRIDNNKVQSMTVRLNLNGDYKATENKITWVSKKGGVLIKLYEFGNLQNDLDTDDLAEKFNEDSKKESWWLAEKSISDAIEKDTIQIERIGFFICDKKYEFNLVPFTKQKRTE